VQPTEIAAALGEFAPRIFAVRLPSMLKHLIAKEPRLRLSIVIWGRLRGLALSRERLHKALDPLTPEKPFTLVQALAEPEPRERLRALAEAERGPFGARAREVEDALAPAED
jgi:hypothetical protein